MAIAEPAGKTTFEAGDVVEVWWSVPVNLRHSPAFGKENTLYEMEKGTKMKVIDGPVLSDGWPFYLVELLHDHDRGWVSGLAIDPVEKAEETSTETRKTRKMRVSPGYSAAVYPDKHHWSIRIGSIPAEAVVEILDEDAQRDLYEVRYQDIRGFSYRDHFVALDKDDALTDVSATSAIPDTETASLNEFLLKNQKLLQQLIDQQEQLIIQLRDENTQAEETIQRDIKAMDRILDESRQLRQELDEVRREVSEALGDVDLNLAHLVREYRDGVGTIWLLKDDIEYLRDKCTNLLGVIAASDGPGVPPTQQRQFIIQAIDNLIGKGDDTDDFHSDDDA